jgi:hypothetical protein
MTAADGFKETLVEVQKAQNVLTSFYGVLMRVLASIPTKLPLHFLAWTPTEYDDEPRKTMWRTPIWDSDSYSAFSHLSLLYSFHNFSTLPQRELYGTKITPAKPAKPGDVILTLKICLNKAFLDVNYDTSPEEWPTVLPITEPYAEAIVFKIMEKVGKESLYSCWLNCDWPEGVGPKGEYSDAEQPGTKFWARSFDLGEFLSNPDPLLEEIRSVIVTAPKE